MTMHNITLQNSNYERWYNMTDFKLWKILTTASNVMILGFKSGASNRIKAPLLPIYKNNEKSGYIYTS